MASSDGLMLLYELDLNERWFLSSSPFPLLFSFVARASAESSEQYDIVSLVYPGVKQSKKCEEVQMRQMRFEGKPGAGPAFKADEKFSFKQVPLAFASLPRAG